MCGFCLNATIGATSCRSAHSFMSLLRTIFGRIQTIQSIYIRSRKHLSPSARRGIRDNSPSVLGAISLAEAVAKAGGLSDSNAEPGYVFLYRGETREVAAQLGLDCSKYAGPIIPVVYNVNFRDPAGYFLATRFQMRNKDVLYISNATTVQTAKAMNFFNLIITTVNNPISAATNVYTLKNIIRGTISTAVSTPSVTVPTP